VIPIGASTALGAAAFALAVAELLEQIPPPDVIVHSTSSGGTQAGLVAGCALAGIGTRVLGISADEPAAELERGIRGILAELGALLDLDAAQFEGTTVEIDDRYVGKGYGVPTTASREAISLLARPRRSSSTHLHGQGDGRLARLPPKGPLRPRRDRALLAHRRPGRVLFA
jgi:L-cysteate sulfo-lyase